MFIGLLGVQTIFYYLQNTQVESAERAIRSILRQELVVSNLFLLSRSVTDLQESGLLKCAVVQKSNSAEPYLDLRYRTRCDSGFWHLDGKEVTSKFNSLNGEHWSISFLANTGRFFSISLWLARVIVLTTTVLALSFFFFRLDREAALRKRKELENEHLSGMVEEKVAEITALKIEASVQKSLATLAQQVSHDIRSPLSALNMVVKRLEGIPEDQRRVIQSASDRINGIANDLLQRHRIKNPPTSAVHSISKVDQELSLKRVVINDFLQSLFEEKQAVIAGLNGICFKLDLTGPLNAQSQIDEKELARVLSNLINNAIEAIGSGPGTITLALRSAMNNIAIIVSDDSRGIPEEVLARLGKERVSCGKEGTESGSGLGVLHAKSAIEAMSGKFMIQSRLGMGTIVTITFPRCDSVDTPA